MLTRQGYNRNLTQFTFYMKDVLSCFLFFLFFFFVFFLFFFEVDLFLRSKTINVCFLFLKLKLGTKEGTGIEGAHLHVFIKIIKKNYRKKR